MVYFVTNRVVIGLRWVAAALAVLGVAVVAGGIAFTTSPEALVSASMIGAMAFGLPAAAAYALAYWLDGQATALHEGRDRQVQAATDGRARAPFSEPAWGYAIAVACALVAWALRVAIDRVLPGYVPFITFFLAVAVAGWLGGFGPAVLAMALSACIARYFYMTPVNALHLHELTTAAALGIFVFVCLVIGALTATLHSALRRIQTLSNRLEALGVAPDAGDAAAPLRQAGSDRDASPRSLSPQD